MHANPNLMPSPAGDAGETLREQLFRGGTTAQPPTTSTPVPAADAANSITAVLAFRGGQIPQAPPQADDAASRIAAVVFGQRAGVPSAGGDGASAQVAAAVFSRPPPFGVQDLAHLFFSGVGAPAASLADPGDYYLDTATGNLYLKS
jgi:hypothetical protein